MSIYDKLEDIETIRLSDFANEPTYQDLKRDFDEADQSRQTQVNKILNYRENMLGGKALPKSVRDRGKSTQRPLVIRKQAEWAYPIMEEPFLSTPNMFIVQPRGKDDEDAAKVNSLMLNWFFNTKIEKTDFVAEFVRTLYDEGTVMVKDGWYSRYDDVEVEYMEPIYAEPEESMNMIKQAVQSGEMDQAQAQAMIETGEPMQIGEEKKSKMERRLVENHPTVEVIDNTNVVVDPTCDGNLANAKFIIHEYEIDFATLEENKYDAESGSGIYKNIDDIQVAEEDADSIYQYRENTQTFRFKDKPRQKVKAYEYWGYWDVDGDGTLTSIVATWVGDTMVRLEENPYAHQELPFSVARYMPRKKEFWGEPDGELLKENQDTIGVYTRAMHDQTITNALGQQITDETLFTTPSQWQAFNKGLNARSRQGIDIGKSIYKAKIEPIDRSVFDMMSMQRQDAESLSGQKVFNDGMTGDSLGSSVGGIKSATDAITKRKLSVLRRISDSLLRNIARHMLSNAAEFMEEKTVMRLTDGEYVDVFKQDIQMEFDLKVEINTPEKEEAISQKIAFMLQTTMQTMPFEMSKALMKRWARVNKMPDVEKDLDEIEAPGPTPEEQQMQQMQMQKMQLELETAAYAKEKIKAEIANLYADRDKTSANTYETMNRMEINNQKLVNETEKTMMMKNKTQEEIDAMQAKFVAHTSGSKRARDVQDMQFKAAVDMSKVNNKPEGNK